MVKKPAPRSTQELNFTPRGTVHASPTDWRDHFIYFLLIDRFDDGAQRDPYDGSRGTHPRDPIAGSAAQGGTLEGVTARMEYIKNLGATAIWLSPVFKNKIDASGAYHGYATQHYLDIDPHIGTKDDLIALVKRAHELGIYVILDIVINHTGDNWAYENDQHPKFNHDGTRYQFGFWRTKHPEGEFLPDDAVWPAELQSPDRYKRRGGIADWNDPQELIDADFLNLKSLDLRDTTVLETLTAIYKYWIVEADIDGYRIDTVKHVENGAAVKFFNGIKEFAASIGKKNFLLFGEIAANDDTITKFVGRQAPTGENLQALDAALDFPLYFVLEEVIKGSASPNLLREREERIRRLYPGVDASDCFVTFLDNHDQMARPFKRFLHNAPNPMQALLGAAYLLTGHGIPSIYYGTEQGFDGGGPNGPFHDAHIRECMFGGRWGAFGTSNMHFFNEKHPLYAGISKIAALRKKEPTLRYGRFYFREISEDGVEYHFPALGFGMIAHSRILDAAEILTALNLRNEQYANHIVLDKSLTPPGTVLIDLLDGTEYLAEERSGRSSVLVTLPPYGIAILKQKEAGA
jgi:glycosidase